MRASSKNLFHYCINCLPTVYHFLCKFRFTRLAMKAKAKRLKKAALTDRAFFK